MDQLVIKLFRKAGFSDVQPRINVMTYNRWITLGFKVRAGEKSIKVKQFRLFHKSQVDAIAPEQSAAQPATNVKRLKPPKGKGASGELPL